MMGGTKFSLYGSMAQTGKHLSAAQIGGVCGSLGLVGFTIYWVFIQH